MTEYYYRAINYANGLLDDPMTAEELTQCLKTSQVQIRLDFAV